MKKLIIFDLDETLIKTEECYNKLMSSVISEKYEVSFEKALRLKKQSEKESHARKKIVTKQDFYNVFEELFLKKLKVEFTEENLSEFRSYIEIVDEKFSSEVKLYEDVLDVLNSLKEKGFKLSILTGSRTRLKPVFTEDFVGSRRKRLLKTFEKTGLDKLIDHHFFAWDHKCLKPDREAFNLPLKYFNIDSKDAIMIGDKDKDLMAKEFGLTTILFDPKSKYKKETKPDYTAKSFKEILDLVEKI